jgi:hypothetical protein
MASKVLYLHDRRQLSDRRRDFIFYSWRQLFGGRRKHLRRSTDHKKLHIDYYEPKLLLIVSTIFVLSFTDAWFTLTLLKRGSTELNPLMDLLISHGIRHFVGYKMALTGLSLVLLVMGHNIRIFGNFRIYHLLWLFLGVYGLLIGYELVLLL